MESIGPSAQLYPAPRPNRGPNTSVHPPSARLSRLTHVRYRPALLYSASRPSPPMFGLAGASQPPRTHFPVLAYLTPSPQCAATPIFAPPLTSINSHQPPSLLQLFLPSPLRSLILFQHRVRACSPPHLRTAFLYMLLSTSKKRAHTDLALFNDLARLL